MFLQIQYAAAFFIKSALDNLYIGTNQINYGVYSMVESTSKAHNFYLKAVDSFNPIEHFIRTGTDRYLDLSLDGKAMHRKPSNLSSVDRFKVLVTENGTMVIQRRDKCLGYVRSNKEVKMYSCTAKQANIEFIFEGDDAMSLTSHRLLYDSGSEEDMKAKEDMRWDDERENYMGKPSRFSKYWNHY